jgi:hypothetical protein
MQFVGVNLTAVFENPSEEASCPGYTDRTRGFYAQVCHTVMATCWLPQQDHDECACATAQPAAPACLGNVSTRMSNSRRGGERLLELSFKESACAAGNVACQHRTR